VIEVKSFRALSVQTDAAGSGQINQIRSDKTAPVVGLQDAIGT